MEPPATQPSPSSSLSLPRTTRALVGAVASFCAACFLSTTLRNALSLIPQSLVRGHVWRLFTAGLFESSLILLIVNLPLFALLARFVEKAWSSHALLALVLAVPAVAAVLASMDLLVLYIIVRDASLIFGKIGTLSGANVSLLMAVRQVLPDHEISLGGGVSVTPRYIPLGYALLICASWVPRIVNIGTVLYTLACFQLSWMYLRFVRKTTLGRGDTSETFSYAALFPAPLSAFVVPIANVCYALIKPVLRRSLPHPQTPQHAQEPELAASISEQGSTFDAERRKQRAIKALEERLSSASDTTNDVADAKV